jgi:hypothetical protein
MGFLILYKDFTITANVVILVGTEAWLSGRKRHGANVLRGFKTPSEVRILPPPQSNFIGKPGRSISYHND